METLYQHIGWPLNKRYGHAVDAFKLSITYVLPRRITPHSLYLIPLPPILPYPLRRPELTRVSSSNPEVWTDIVFPSPSVQSELQSYISKRLTPQPTKVRADVEVTCFGYEGIDAVKHALLAGESLTSDTITVKVKLVSPPLYVLTSQCLDKSTGIKVLEDAILAIQARIVEAKGNCVVKMAPKAVTESDDAELQALMEKRERENMEISGDEDESGSDEGPAIQGDI